MIQNIHIHVYCFSLFYIVGLLLILVSVCVLANEHTGVSIRVRSPACVWKYKCKLLCRKLRLCTNSCLAEKLIVSKHCIIQIFAKYSAFIVCNTFINYHIWLHGLKYYANINYRFSLCYTRKKHDMWVKYMYTLQLVVLLIKGSHRCKYFTERDRLGSFNILLQTSNLLHMCVVK